MDKDSEFNELANRRLEELLANATNDSIRTKLRNLHEVCAQLIRERRGFSVPIVVKRYGERFTEPSQQLAEQSIRNNRKNGNPYQSLYKTWTVVAQNIATSSRRKVSAHGGIIGEPEILAIPDQTLRHQMLMLLAQNRSLHNQLNTIKAGRTDLPITVHGRHLGTGPRLALTEAQIDALRDFVDPRKLKAKGLERTDDDALRSKSGDLISDPGLFAALEQILREATNGAP